MEYFIKTSQKSKEVTRRCFKADKIPPKNFKGELHRFSQLNNRVSKNLKSIFFLTYLKEIYATAYLIKWTQMWFLINPQSFGGCTASLDPKEQGQ